MPSTSKPSRSKSKNNGISKSTTKRGIKPTTPSTSTTKKRGRPSKSFIDDAASEDDDEHDDDEDEEAEDNDGPSALELVDMDAEQDDNEDAGDVARYDDEDEADMMLVEVSHDRTAEEERYPIPPALVHTMLHHHFARPSQTKISTDARDLVARYLEVFVREAIARSVYEREEKEKDAGGGERWLEVEDLEGVAVQLGLDF